MTNALTVRNASATDAAAVAAVHVAAWQIAYRGLVPDGYLDAMRPEERAARYTFGSTDASLPQTVVAVGDRGLRGFATVGRARDEADGVGELLALYVEPRCWRMGIGRLLIRHAHARLRALGFEEAVLWLLVGNEPAARFYEAEGWQPDGTRRQEEIWGVNVDVIRYRRVLARPMDAPAIDDVVTAWPRSSLRAPPRATSSTSPAPAVDSGVRV